MKYAKQRRWAPSRYRDPLLDVLLAAAPFPGGLADLIETYPEEDEEAREPPDEVVREIQRRASAAYAQITAELPPPTTWASGVGRGFIRQNIERELEAYWWEHGELPGDPMLEAMNGLEEAMLKQAAHWNGIADQAPAEDPMLAAQNGLEEAMQQQMRNLKATSNPHQAPSSPSAGTTPPEGKGQD